MLCSDCAILLSALAAENKLLADCARLIASSSEMDTGGAAACWAEHNVLKSPPRAPITITICRTVFMRVCKLRHRVTRLFLRLGARPSPELAATVIRLRR